MDPRLLKMALIGLAIVALVVAGVFYMQRGAHIELRGSILKVRTLAMDETSTVMVVDFRFVNPSDYNFVVRKAEVYFEDPDGRVAEGQHVAEVDAKRLFGYYPVLGQKFNDSLVLRDKIGPRQSLDRMLAVRFDLPEATVQRRRKLVVRIEEVDGAVSELTL